MGTGNNSVYRCDDFYFNLSIVVITLAVSMKFINILALFSIDFSVTIVAATHVLSWK